jgi:soluble lytic murein transglycosylase-like protein
MLKAAIRYAALDHNLREEIVAAVVWQESKGNPLAIRYEDRFYKNRILPRDRSELSGFVPSSYHISLDTEKIMRSCSFGLMQVMGETLRWHTKAKAPYLTAYLDSALNLDAGCHYLAYLLHRSKGDYTKALRLYNGSRFYPPKILDAVQKKSYLPMYS